MSEKLITELATEYENMQEAIAEMYGEVRNKHRKAEREEKAKLKRELEKSFAVKFELARRSGVKRYELEMPVLRTKNGDRYKHFVELGGGELRQLETAQDKELKQEEERLNNLEALLEQLNLVRIEGGFFQIVGQTWKLVWQSGSLMPEPFKDFEASVYVKWHKEHEATIQELRKMEGQ